MTGIQDWLSPPVGAVKALVCDVLRRRQDRRTEVRYEPVLIRPGIERC
ncbi:MAG: hypothetical protein ABWY20_18270 [Mycobacterium sp.]